MGGFFSDLFDSLGFFVLDVLWQHHGTLLKISDVLIYEVLRLVYQGWKIPFPHREVMGS